MGNNIFIILMIFASVTAMAVARPEDSGISCGPNAEDIICSAYGDPSCYPSPFATQLACLELCRVSCQCSSESVLNNLADVC
ncbi:uncharacterized protein LOC125777708 isoform X5 [Bactrocera dorsalis]|uniref:Uncharacterized protein LOC125777708 isoform X5 n=1 Tax=Bactrocera dorsalis TaxID=27457 RepID=A0ABM3JI97_BACDO|nr:uncharacterized protein LOC125777708 isoform X5 [Bactrocera dorsalis]